MPRQWLQTSQTEMEGQNEGREMLFEIGLSGDQKRPKTENEQLGPEDQLPELLKMLFSTMITGYDDGNTLTVHSRRPRGMCRERTSMVKLARGFTRIFLKGMSKRASW